ncbi:MAG: copper chaperone PCu(A)C [Proteobacteria bacterium]|nr:copper chaperone PCu(A)C [Pseudomonadota bacterium]MBS0571808.1 copper chaperone PCu(A)C [Pseudomonadota bacterium]
MSLARRPFLAALAFAALAAPALAHDGVHVENAFARFVPGARTGAVYMTIENHAKVEDRLVSVSTDAGAKAEIHRSAQGADGVMTMDALPDGLAIAPGAIAELKSGGDHIMVMDLNRHPKPGDSIEVTLTFSHAGTVKLSVPVRK